MSGPKGGSGPGGQASGPSRPGPIVGAERAGPDVRATRPGAELLGHVVAAASSWQKGQCTGQGGRAHRRGTIMQLLGDPKQAKDTPNAARRGAETQGRWRPREI